MRTPRDLSDKYWNSLTPEHQALYQLIRPQPKAAYSADTGLLEIEKFIAEQTNNMQMMGGSFELVPDFQRGHVWTVEQRKSYVEALFKSTASTHILFNCPGWLRSDGDDGDIAAHTFQCIDGLQRLTSVRQFVAGDLSVFNGMTADDFKGSPFDLKRYRLKFSVYEFSHRAELLQFYLDLNGGTVHAQSELDRVQQLLDEIVTPDEALCLGDRP